MTLARLHYLNGHQQWRYLNDQLTMSNRWMEPLLPDRATLFSFTEGTADQRLRVRTWEFMRWDVKPCGTTYYTYREVQGR